jgi:hypothetical protein
MSAETHKYKGSLDSSVFFSSSSNIITITQQSNKYASPSAQLQKLHHSNISHRSSDQNPAVNMQPVKTQPWKAVIAEPKTSRATTAEDTLLRMKQVDGADRLGG